MKLAIMQPYFIPYIGYWQLMDAVDRFVIFDDVNYIVRGWINRNRILIDGEAKYIHLPLKRKSQNMLIRDILVDHDPRLMSDCLKKLEFAYRNAPFFEQVFPLAERILTSPEDLITDFLRHSFDEINDYLGIDAEIVMSSEIEKDAAIRGEEKIIEICRAVGAEDYINPIGGRDLYDAAHFSHEGISLSFVKTGDITYRQFKNEFVPNLSIMDIMMFNDVNEIQEMLKNYTLIH